MHKFYWNNARGGNEGSPRGYQDQGPHRPYQAERGVIPGPRGYQQEGGYPERFQNDRMVQREYMHSGDPVHLYNEPPYRHSQPGSGYNGAVIENSGTVRVSVTADNSCRTDRQQEKQTCGIQSLAMII
ncbi:uncharacterized protein LOC111704630 [Eurytemora carolleeae]|uniref:uncharacterized protein LOC111704630 n=1 Tax=Eurytemora carolleeae TaxID=1294199 RepID=UPI000C794609|nr:uncharacterized protein LOC111704630 [Eurytemora carolleeae]|eukprot:XP_023332688.1 uncharacterized protein LOC111704630 [Eurytemora affinis]